MAVKGELLEGKIKVGVPKEIEKRFFTIRRTNLYEDIHVFKKPLDISFADEDRVIKAENRATDGVWEIELNLSEIGKEKK